MSYSFQIAVDAEKPHEQADWWAETLGWQVEPSDEDFIRSMLSQGFAKESDTSLHRGVLVWKDGAAINAPEAQPGSPRILFQTAPEKKTVKNRMHLDIRVQSGESGEKSGDSGDQGKNKDEIRAALEARGARFLWRASQGPHDWYTMADPEGNEFCIS